MKLNANAALVPVLLLALGCSPAGQDENVSGASAESETNGDRTSAALMPTDETQLRRLLVLTRPDQSIDDVVEAANRHFPTVVTAEPLFPDVDDEMLSRSYIVIATGADPSVQAWDEAYTFQTLGDFELVEPDREDTLEPAFRNNAAASGCASGGGTQNSDTAWALKKVNAASAWELVPSGSGKRFGEGVSVCHPDTGWTPHDDLDGLDFDRAHNVIDNNNDARDPHNSGMFLNPGHGTATGSVIGSRGGIAADSGTTLPGKITGVAPQVTIVPIRTVNSVIQVFDSDVAKAVTYAVDAKCDVVSMSLGGRGFFGLRRAVKYAVDNGLILVAASGNCVGSIVAPAAYKETIAAAATNDQDVPWKGSSKGRGITLSAPGESVWNADGQKSSNLPADIKVSDGTSFATAEIAGAAALWLAFHTRESIEQAAGGERISDLFVRVLQASARTPAGWDASKYGPGILDTEALLKQDITAVGPILAPPQTTRGQEAVQLLATVIDRDPAEVARALDVLLGDPEDFDAAVARWMPEMIDVALRNPESFDIALDEALSPPDEEGGPPRVQARGALEPLLSDALNGAIQ